VNIPQVTQGVLQGHTDVQLELTLTQLYSVTRVCAGVTMRQVRDAAHESRVHRCPDDLDAVQVNVWEVNVAEGGSGELERLAWTVGDGTAMVGLEKAVCRIGVGHKVRLTLQDEMTLPDIPAEIPAGEELSSTELTLDVELVAHERGPGDKVSLSAEQKLARGEELKQRGTALFAAGRLGRAEAVWAQGVSLFNVLMAEDAFGGASSKTRQDNQRQHDAQVPLLLNTALCKLKRGAWAEAAIDCTEVLDLQPKNAKALFRRGKARMETGEWLEAERDLKRAQQCDRAVRAEVAAQLRELAKRMTAQDKKDMAELGSLFEKGEVYSAADVAPPPKPKPKQTPVQIPSLQEEFENIAEEEEDVALRRKQDWYNSMIRTGQMRLITSDAEEAELDAADDEWVPPS